MRIYLLNIDAAPLYDFFGDHLREQGFHQSSFLVNGMFTISSVKSMYTGKVYDRIQPGDPNLIDVLLDAGVKVEIHGAYASFVRVILEEDDLVEDTLVAPRASLRTHKPSLRREQYGDILISVPTNTPGRFRD